MNNICFNVNYIHIFVFIYILMNIARADLKINNVVLIFGTRIPCDPRSIPPVHRECIVL